MRPRRLCRHTLHTFRGPIGAPPKVQVGAARMRPRRRQLRPRYHPAEGRGRPEEGEEKEEWLLPIGVLARCAIQSGGPCPASRVSGAACLGVCLSGVWVRVSGVFGIGCLGQGVWVRVRAKVIRGPGVGVGPVRRGQLGLGSGGLGPGRVTLGWAQWPPPRAAGEASSHGSCACRLRRADSDVEYSARTRARARARARLRVVRCGSKRARRDPMITWKSHR